MLTLPQGPLSSQGLESACLQVRLVLCSSQWCKLSTAPGAGSSFSGFGAELCPTPVPGLLCCAHTQWWDLTVRLAGGQDGLASQHQESPVTNPSWQLLSSIFPCHTYTEMSPPQRNSEDASKNTAHGLRQGSLADTGQAWGHLPA